MQTLQAIRIECLRRLREDTSTPTLWSNTQINNFINDACSEIANRTECLWGKHTFFNMAYTEIPEDMPADKTVADGEVYTIVLSPGQEYDFNGYQLTQSSGGFIEWYEGDVLNNSRFTLPEEVIDIPRSRVIYNEDTHLDFKSFPLINYEDERWEDASAGTPSDWFQRDARYLYVTPPISLVGEKYGFDNETGRVVRIEDDDDTYTFSAETGKIISIQDDSSGGDYYEFITGTPIESTREDGRIVKLDTPVSNLKITYTKEHPTLTKDSDTTELHQIYLYLIYSYVLWHAYNAPGDGKDMYLGNLYESEYNANMTALMPASKTRHRGSQARIGYRR